MFFFREQRGPIEVAFTERRLDGRAFNLALPGTAPAAVGDPVADHGRLRAELGAERLLGLRQVHGSAVADVVPAADDDAPEADAAVAGPGGAFLMVRAADCVPVLIAGDDGTAVAVAHAGRLGVQRGVVPAVLARLRERTAAPLTAWVGPHICGRCYEVPAAMRDEVADGAPAAASTTSWGTPALDLGAAVEAQLRTDAQVGEVRRVPGCTREDERLWSHRREGSAAGRLAGVIGVRS